MLYLKRQNDKTSTLRIKFSLISFVELVSNTIFVFIFLYSAAQKYKRPTTQFLLNLISYVVFMKIIKCN